MLTTPSGSSACWQISAKASAVSGARLGRLEDDGVPGRQCGCDLPGEHQQREVPRDHLAGDTQGPGGGADAGVLQLVRPAGVVEEVRRHQREVDVAGLADRLAVVQ
jgi:hypothetical protein